MTTTLRVCAVAMVVATGITLKLARYLPERQETDLAAVETQVERLMKAHGWLRSPLVEDPTANLYPRMQFRRPECPDTINVAVLGGNGEVADYFLVQHGGDAAFLQDGQFRDRPSGWARQLATLRLQLSGMAGNVPSHALPLLAIAPRPDGAGACRGPAAVAWLKSLKREGDH